MKKIVIAILMIGLALIVGFSAHNNYASGSLKALQNGFEASGAELVEITFNAWGSLTLPSLSEESLRGVLADGVQSALGITPTSFDILREEDFIMVQVEVALGECVLHASAQSMQGADSQEAYLVVSIYSRSEADGINMVRERLLQFFAPTKTKPEMTACLLGVFPRQLSPQETATLVAKVLTALRGEMHESYSDQHVISVQGGSNRLPGGVTIGERKSNFALVIRYNPIVGNTFLWMAWPAFTLSV